MRRDLVGVDLDGRVQGRRRRARGGRDRGRASAATPRSRRAGPGIKIICRGKTARAGPAQRQARDLSGAKRFLHHHRRPLQRLARSDQSPRSRRSTHLWQKHFSKPRARANGSSNGHHATPCRPIPTRPRSRSCCAIRPRRRTGTRAAPSTPSTIARRPAGIWRSPAIWRARAAAATRDRRLAARLPGAPCAGQGQAGPRRLHLRDRRSGDRRPRTTKTKHSRQAMPAVRRHAGQQPRASRRYSLAEVHDVFRRWLGDEYDLDTLNAVLASRRGRTTARRSVMVAGRLGTRQRQDRDRTSAPGRWRTCHQHDRIRRRAAVSGTETQPRQRRDRWPAAQARRPRAIGDQGRDVDPVGQSRSSRLGAGGHTRNL